MAIRFAMLGPDGKVVKEPATLKRIRALVIPPAWTDVWICGSPYGHLQAVGRDIKDESNTVIIRHIAVKGITPSMGGCSRLALPCRGSASKSMRTSAYRVCLRTRYSLLFFIFSRVLACGSETMNTSNRTSRMA